MRILFAGDCHGATDHVKALINEAGKRECDRIFVLGDFGYWEHMADGVKFLDKVSAFAIKRGISVYFLDGNHDKTSLLLEKYADEPNDEGFLTVRGRLFYAPRGHQWTWDGVSFIALGGAYSVDKQWRLDQERKGKRKGGTLWFPEEEMTDEDMLNILGTVSRVDVMLAHDKPFDSKPKWNRKAFEECAPNQLRLQWAVDALKPSMFLHGHLHYAYTDYLPSTETFVHGLDCDPWAAQYPGWSLDRSLLVFDTTKFGADQLVLEAQRMDGDGHH